MKKLLLLAMLLCPLLAFAQSQGTAVRALNGYGTNTLFFHDGVPTRQVGNMFAGFLYDYPNGNLSLDWFNRKGYDGTVESFDWFNRTFSGTAWIFLSITNHNDVSAGAFASGNVWGYDGLTAKWTNGPPAASSGGTVTSVAQTVPGQFSVAGSPITISGTFAITLTNATGVSNSPIVLKTNATVSGLTKEGSTTNKNVAASSLMGVQSQQIETNIVVGTGLSLSGNVLTATNQFRTNAILTVTIQNGGAVITTGTVQAYPVAGDSYTISGWSITAVGLNPTCTIDVWKIANGTALPLVGNSIMGTKPALASGNVIESTTLTAWNTTVTKGDIWGVNVDAVSVATSITFQIFGYR